MYHLGTGETGRKEGSARKERNEKRGRKGRKGRSEKKEKSEKRRGKNVDAKEKTGTYHNQSQWTKHWDALW